MKWTRRRDRALLDMVIADPRRAIGRFARKCGVSPLEIKRHMRAIGLVVLEAPLPRTCKHGTPRMGHAVCADCAEEESLCL